MTRKRLNAIRDALRRCIASMLGVRNAPIRPAWAV